MAPALSADRSGPSIGDCSKTILNGRWVWHCPNGTFEADPATGGPDGARPVDHEWPTLDQLLAEAERRDA